MFDFFTREEISADKTLYLTGQSVLEEPALHLPETVNSPTIFPDVDADGDGFVDGTKIPYDNDVSPNGVADPDNHTNVNITIPPKYIRYIRCEGAPEIFVPDTCEGGFFAETEFITDKGVFVGTSGHTDTSGFIFKPVKELKMD